MFASETKCFEYFCDEIQFLVRAVNVSPINLCFTGLNIWNMDTGGKYNSSWNECYSANSFSKFLTFITNIFLTEFPKLSEKIIRQQDSPLVTGVPQVISNKNVKCAAY